MNRMKHVLALAAITASLSGSARAADQTLLVSGTCQASNEYGDVFFAAGAAFATWENDTGYITCGVGQDNALDTNDDVLVYYNDLSGAENVRCYMYEVARDHSTIVYVGALYGCSTAGGCAADPGTFASAGYLRFVDVQHGGDYSASLLCGIPAAENGYNSSIRSIVVDEQ
ncbi:MAG: hypothetical protein R3B13_37410 [Polyangiaceae bacterium]